MALNELKISSIVSVNKLNPYKAVGKLRMLLTIKQRIILIVLRRFFLSFSISLITNNRSILHRP